MTQIVCNNKLCIYNNLDNCQQDFIRLSNDGHAKVFWFSCWQYMKRTTQQADSANQQKYEKPQETQND